MNKGACLVGGGREERVRGSTEGQGQDRGRDGTKDGPKGMGGGG